MAYIARVGKRQGGKQGRYDQRERAQVASDGCRDDPCSARVQLRRRPERAGDASRTGSVRCRCGIRCDVRTSLMRRMAVSQQATGSEMEQRRIADGPGLQPGTPVDGRRPNTTPMASSPTPRPQAARAQREDRGRTTPVSRMPSTSGPLSDARRIRRIQSDNDKTESERSWPPRFWIPFSMKHSRPSRGRFVSVTTSVRFFVHDVVDHVAAACRQHQSQAVQASQRGDRAFHSAHNPHAADVDRRHEAGKKASHIALPVAASDAPGRVTKQVEGSGAALATWR